VHRKDLLVNDSSDWQTVETICKSLPQFDVVSSLALRRRQSKESKCKRQRAKKSQRTLVVKPVNPVYARAFVVPSQDEKVFWVFDFVRE
jgi:hypothetical protein